MRSGIYLSTHIINSKSIYGLHLNFKTNSTELFRRLEIVNNDCIVHAALCAGRLSIH